jgi:hypothetical protein
MRRLAATYPASMDAAASCSFFFFWVFNGQADAKGSQWLLVVYMKFRNL